MQALEANLDNDTALLSLGPLPPNRQHNLDRLTNKMHMRGRRFRNAHLSSRQL